MNEFKQELAERAEQVDRLLASFLRPPEGYQKRLFRAMNYGVRAGGKRIRPIIMSEVCEMCGGTDVAALGPFMGALEMIHTYSLIHDDLPAMDDDDYRRGRPTTHKEFGEAMGILAGDGLLNLAYETAFRAFSSYTDRQYIMSALNVLGRKAGMHGMVGGQSVDVETNGKFVDEDMLLYVYRTKTAALFEAAFMIGGILAGVSEEEEKLLERAGTGLGLAFQIQDDVLDVTGNEELLGKPLHSDEKNEKTTYVSLFGMEASQRKIQDYTDEAVACLEQFGGEKEFLLDLIGWLVVREM